ncbi:DUF2800 domain-containing protein [Novosphingobium sp. YJ-S2-02]|uniref:DUF2800 domain-containing protein n=1 Tax=Novosphingobium aureum TaxID=2792964 RepID=A0A931MKV3_9SPHN|nr:DUF2800 domain-containing protein [Novosphingobium aureum]MBH0113213.1 DUF2800 domain-containing protein [Novosphingobium aureum]
MSNPDRIGDELAHSPYGPSRADGYTGCLDYVAANDGLPDDTSEQAAEGTFAHVISDNCFSLDMDALDFVGHRMTVEGFTFEWSEEDAFLLQPGIDFIRSFGGTFYGEQRVDIARWTCAGQFGTLDRVVIAQIDGEWWVILIDLKWGRGVPVIPARNKQLVLYALGVWEMIRDQFPDKPPRFMLGIDQPRCPGGGGLWRTDLHELEVLGNYIKSCVEVSETFDNLPRTASEAACIWCRRKKARGGCATFDNWRLNLLQVSDAQVDSGSEPDLLATSLSPEQRAYLLRHRKGIEYWFKQLDEAALEDTLDGLPAGGLKVVEDSRKGSRDKWIDEKAAAEVVEPILGENAFTRKLKTVKQLCKHLSPDDREKLDGLFKPGESGFSLVPEEDARPAVVRVDADDFDDL